MGYEREGELVVFRPGPVDVHTHPRIFDAITADNFVSINDGQEGKAGLRDYTLVALKSGITVAIAMPNESVRLYDPHTMLTGLLPYPVSNKDRLLAVQAAISTESHLPMAVHLGLDPEDMFLDEKRQHIDEVKVALNFAEAGPDCTSLKIYGAETTGGYNIETTHIPRIVELWYEQFPEKPIVMHLEDEDVSRVLKEIEKLPIGKDVPIHIAHVSSRKELVGVTIAKEKRMNVTCEVTPHHLFLDKSVKEEIGGYGCMKPSLKEADDLTYLRANLDAIDIFASDCAPHRRSDKEAENPAYGVTNHSVMLRLLLGAVEDGWLSMDQLYEKLCINPRVRFNLSLEDDSEIKFDMKETTLRQVMAETSPRYGFEPFTRLNRFFHLVGNIISANTGKSSVQFDENSREAQIDVNGSYTHLLR